MEIHASVEIDRPAREVFTVLADFERNPEWQQGMRSARWTSDPPVGVGSTYDQEARFLGRDVMTSFEVVDYQPGQSITIESRQSTFPIRVTRSVEPMGSGRTRVTAHISGGPGGVMRIFQPIVKRIAQRSIRRDYQRLRNVLEAQTDRD